MHRLLKPGGRLALTTIHIAPGLTTKQQRRAVTAGPPEVRGPDVADLLARAGFADVHAEDATAEFHAAAKSWLATRLRHRDALRALNPQAYDERIAVCTAEDEALTEGLVRR